MLDKMNSDRDAEVYTGDTLRALVKAALKKTESEAAVDTPKQYTDKDVADNVELLKGLCIDVAKQGKVEAYLNFNDLPQELLIDVSAAFRKVYPDVMIIKELGRNRLIVNWSGNNEC